MRAAPLLALAGTCTCAPVVRTFVPSAFVMKRQVGQLGVATETEWQYYGGHNPLDPSQPTRTVEASGASVRLFEADLYGRRCLLKEYLGEATEIGKTELDTYKLLYSQLADSDGAPVQVGTMLGYMYSDASFDTDSFQTQWRARLPNTPPPAAGNLWTVFAWEGFQTVAEFPRAPQERDFWDWRGDGARARRGEFVKAIALRALEVLAWLHGRGVVHRSIGGSSLLLNTLDQRAASLLAVKAIDLGFATSASALTAEEVESAMRRGAANPLEALSVFALTDLHQLGYVLLELVLAAMCDYDGSGGGRSIELQQLKRLIEDVFDDDLDGFRTYCVEEPSWASAVALLDERDRAGWSLLQQLVDCHKSDTAKGVTALSLLESEWLRR